MGHPGEHMRGLLTRWARLGTAAWVCYAYQQVSRDSGSNMARENFRLRLAPTDREMRELRVRAEELGLPVATAARIYLRRGLRVPDPTYAPRPEPRRANTDTDWEFG